MNALHGDDADGAAARSLPRQHSAATTAGAECGASPCASRGRQAALRELGVLGEGAAGMTATAWCYQCGAFTVPGVGSHRPDGSFDVESVEVSYTEIEAATRQARVAHHKTMARVDKARRNIALGKHSGVYQLVQAGS